MNDRALEEKRNTQPGGSDELTPDDAWLYRKFLPVFVPVVSLAVVFLFGWSFFGFGLGFLYALGFPLACGLGVFVLSRHKKGQDSPHPVQPLQPHAPMAPHPASPQGGIHAGAMPPAWVPGASFASMQRSRPAIPAWVKPLVILGVVGALCGLAYFFFPNLKELVASKFNRNRFAMNEANTIQYCTTYAEAQEIYRRTDWDGDGELEYANSIRGENSLFEKNAGKADLTLVSERFAMAEANAKGAKPCCGYLYKVLTSQGTHAKGGAMSYLKSDSMTKGHALVAWPAEYGKSGRQTFMVSQEGKVHQKDLGKDTGSICTKMAEFDPGEGWAVADLAAALEAAQKEVEPAPPESLQVVEKWLTALKQGQNGAAYWDDPNSSKVLYAVENWRVLTHQTGPEENEATVNARIWSATKGGQEVVVDWSISLKQMDGRWAIGSIEERNK